MRRYWIDKKFFNEKEVLLMGDEFHHICEVCRLGLEDRFEILCDGKAYFVQIKSMSEKGDRQKMAVAKILEERKIAEISKPQIHLCVAISKFQTMDTIVEKAVELGVFKLYPFVSEFSFVREKQSERLDGKQERWKRIVKSATQQTGRGQFMEISETLTLKELLKKMNQETRSVGLFPYEGTSLQTVKEAINEIKSQKPDNIWVFVGSEGGFSYQEVDLFSAFGLKPASLGDQILRVETACLSLVSILKYEIS